MKPPVILSPESLFAQRDDVHIIDCRFSLADFEAGMSSFAAGHIEGAVHWDMERGLAGEKSGSNGRHPLPSLADFEA